VHRTLLAAGLLAFPIFPACSGGDDKAETVRLDPGAHVLKLGSELSVGDHIICSGANGSPDSKGSVPERGKGVGSGTGFSISTDEDGTVKVNCPRT
jgi:hypothetical protein